MQRISTGRATSRCERHHPRTEQSGSTPNHGLDRLRARSAAFLRYPGCAPSRRSQIGAADGNPHRRRRCHDWPSRPAGGEYVAASGLPWCLCNAVGGAHRGIEHGNHRNARNLFTDMR